MLPPRILLKQRFDLCDVQIIHDPQPRDIDPSLRAKMDIAREHEKEKRLQQGRKTWDGVFYRVNNCSNLLRNNTIVLSLSEISYRYIAVFRDFVDFYQQNPWSTTDHLAVASIIETADGDYLFGRRPNNSIDLIGGWAQPWELSLQSWYDIELTMLKELYEEAGITHHHISSLHGLGVLFSYKSTILVICHTTLHLSTQECLIIFEHRTDHEMISLEIISANELQAFLGSLSSYRPLVWDLVEGG